MASLGKSAAAGRATTRGTVARKSVPRATGTHQTAQISRHTGPSAGAGSRKRAVQQTLQHAAFAPAASVQRDLSIMLLTGAVLYFTLAVYWPLLVRPAGPPVRAALHTALGAGMWLLPMCALLMPVLLIASSAWRPLLLRAFAWAWTLVLLTTLTAGLWTGRGWGGLVGDSLAGLGYHWLGWFYPVVIVLLAVLAALRLGGRALFFPLARGAWQVAAATGSAAVKLGEVVQTQAAEAGERRREAKSKAEAERDARRSAVIAAELEAANSPEGSSALIRDDEATRVGEDGVRPRKRRGGSLQVVALEAGSVEDADEFAAALDAAVGVPAIHALESNGRGGSVTRPDEPRQQRGRVTDPPLPDPALLTEAEGADEPRLHAPWPERSVPEVLGEGQLRLFASTQAGYQLPPLELLRDAPQVAGEEAHLPQRAATIERTLASFNIEAKCVDAVVGPRVTRYELTIGPGINVSKIHAIADNLALELAVKAVRIEAPIPGKRAVGIEVPNAAPQVVSLKSILSSPLMQRSNHPLTVAVGRDIAGHPVIANLAKMPHLLVAGATGSGKSVCLNTLIVSLLMRNAPDTLRLILIDPKRVELTSYEEVPHLACPVVCDVNQAQSALKWVVAEMDRRYRLLQSRRARNIAAFNESAEPAERLPFIVVILDELADLMMLAGQTVEKLIARITQLSRAVGIHLVIATQRPDVKVITGTIKANVPSRIAFAVVSQVDSRVILDGGGADKLLGGGDMLFSPIGESVPMRVQGCFLADDEIDAVVGHCRDQAAARLDESILSFGLAADGTPGAAYDVPTLELDGTLRDDASSGDTPVADRDPLFDEARAIVMDTQRASTSYLQRRLKIGYNRAARIMEELQTAGIVSEPDVRGDRKVL